MLGLVFSQGLSPTVKSEFYKIYNKITIHPCCWFDVVQTLALIGQGPSLKFFYAKSLKYTYGLY